MTDLHHLVVGYLERTGWLPPAEEGELGGLWRLPGCEFLVPVPHVIDPDGLDWNVVVTRLAFVEGRVPSAVCADIVGPDPKIRGSVADALRPADIRLLESDPAEFVRRTGC